MAPLEGGLEIKLDRVEASPPVRLHVLIACHNRRDLTVRAITTFAGAAAAVGALADFTVFDDGSTDGTAEALASLELPVTRIAGDGSAFWSRSMAEAEDHVLQTYDDYGYVVWLNDDVELDADFLEVAFAAAKSNPSAVLVGAMRDPDTGQLTYSGARRGGWHALNFASVEPNGTLQSIETFNGNLVFVPTQVARALGGIDGSFSHSGADTDYGMRLGEGGFELLLLPRIVGSCPFNPIRPLGPVMDDWRRFLSVKSCGNYDTMKRILRKRYPHTWFGYISVTYSLWWARRFAHIRVPHNN
jgi:GT2 family glycosyltransferase